MKAAFPGGTTYAMQTIGGFGACTGDTAYDERI